MPCTGIRRWWAQQPHHTLWPPGPGPTPLGKSQCRCARHCLGSPQCPTPILPCRSPVPLSPPACIMAHLPVATGPGSLTTATGLETATSNVAPFKATASVFNTAAAGGVSAPAVWPLCCGPPFLPFQLSDQSWPPCACRPPHAHQGSRPGLRTPCPDVQLPWPSLRCWHPCPLSQLSPASLPVVWRGRCPVMVCPGVGGRVSTAHCISCLPHTSPAAERGLCGNPGRRCTGAGWCQRGHSRQACLLVHCHACHHVVCRHAGRCLKQVSAEPSNNCHLSGSACHHPLRSQRGCGWHRFPCLCQHLEPDQGHRLPLSTPAVDFASLHVRRSRGTRPDPSWRTTWHVPVQHMLTGLQPSPSPNTPDLTAQTIFNHSLLYYIHAPLPACKVYRQAGWRWGARGGAFVMR